MWRDREAPRARKGKRVIRVLRASPVHRAKEAYRVPKGRKEKEASPVLKDLWGPQGQWVRREILVLRAPPARRAREASRVLKGH